MDTSIDTITNNIQLALAPVFLLTAVATLLNAISTRLARTVDRMRDIQQNIYVLQFLFPIAPLRMLKRSISGFRSSNM